MHVNFDNSTPSTSRAVNPENAAEQKFLSAKVESNGRNFRERTGAFQKKRSLTEVLKGDAGSEEKGGEALKEKREKK